jgi:hypothetical protein
MALRGKFYLDMRIMANVAFVDKLRKDWKPPQTFVELPITFRQTYLISVR